MKHDQIAKWVMSFLFLAAALVLGSNTSISKYGYVIFMSGHMLGTYVFIKTKDMALLWQNFLFMAVDAFGVYRWLFT